MKTLEKYLLEKLPNYLISLDEHPDFLVPCLKSKISSPFSVKCLQIEGQISLDRLLALLEQFYLLQNRWLCLSESFPVKHSGKDLTFQWGHKKIYLVVLPFALLETPVFKVFLVEVDAVHKKGKQYDVPFTLADFKDKSFFPQRRSQQK